MSFNYQSRNLNAVPITDNHALSFQGKTDMIKYHEVRKQKYSLRPVFKALDLERNGMVNVDVFIAVAKDNGIFLNDSDKHYLRTTVAVQNRINYEDIIRDLVLVGNSNDHPQSKAADNQTNKSLTRDGTFSHKQYHIYHHQQLLSQWILRSNNQALVDQIKNTEDALFYQDMLKVKKKNQLKLLGQYKTQQNSKTADWKANIGSKVNEVDDDRQNDANQEKHLLGSINHQNLINQPLTMNTSISNMDTYSAELRQVIKKITGQTLMRQKAVAQDWSHHTSAGSKKMNILKNIQNKIFIKQTASQHQIQSKKDKIRRYMKDNGVNISHLNEISSAFLDCDEERTGLITKRQLLEKIAQNNIQFPADFLFSIIYDMQVNAEDKSEEAVLSFENLKNIIEVYNNCPIFLKGDSNNSDSFKQNMDKNKDDQVDQYDRLDKLFKYVHIRIEEKFKDFRQAFRNFDKNFDGGLNFKEFITGMDSIGLRLKLSDYKMIFDTLDYDGEGEIGFFKFCLLNTDRKQDLQKLKQEHLLKQQHIEQSKQNAALTTQSSMNRPNKHFKKPPLPNNTLASLAVTGQSQDQSQKSGNGGHPLFGDGNIPKNKDINNFTKDIQDITSNQTYMSRRFHRSAQKFGLRTYQDFPDTHSFGLSKERSHDMVALLTNSYSDNLKRMSIEELRSSITNKSIQAKQTASSIMREQAIKLKYKPTGGRSCSLTPSNKLKENREIKQKSRSKMLMNMTLSGTNKLFQRSANHLRGMNFE